LPSPRLILASASPRRVALLRDAGFEPEVDAAEIDESTFPPGMLPSQVAMYLAEAKVKIVGARHPDDIVLAADTIVTFGDQMLGKPNDAAHAKKMLQLLSGTTHLVITGVSVHNGPAKMTKSIRVMSAVRMRLLSPVEIDQYVATRAWDGKAGGYGIQDPDPFVVRQAGSHTNIVGLPMSATKQLLADEGVFPNK
jgi:septum formation protein